MPYRLLSGDANLADGLRRIAEEQLAKAASALDSPGIDDHEAVHELRKRCKRIRALLRLVRDGLEDRSVFREENALYRSLARGLSGYRDATALIESLDALAVAISPTGESGALSSVREVLVSRRQAMESTADFARGLAQARAALTARQAEVHRWTRLPDDFDSLEGGLERALRRATRAMHEAREDPRAENDHEWRKRVTDHRHHCRILAPVDEAPMEARVELLDELALLLGRLHDLAVLEDAFRREPLSAEPQAVELLFGLIHARRTSLRGETQSLGGALFCEEPRQFVRRTRVRYDRWRKVWKSERSSQTPSRGSRGPGAVSKL